MATNKRKDAAALFELIDKSTLKVPKAAGSLKIPHWWSSKTNRAASPPHPAGATESAKSPPSPSPAAPGSKSPRPPGEAPTAAPPPPVAMAAILEPPQPRLFDPPPASRPTSASPTIRPPSASVRPPVSPPVSPSVRPPSPPALPNKTSPPAAAAPPQVSASPRPAPISAAPVPLSAAPRNPFAPPRPGAFARLPAWVMVTFGSCIVIVVCLLVYLVEHHPRSGTPSSASANTPGSSPYIPAQGTSQSATGAGHILPAPMAGTPQQLLPRAAGPTIPAQAAPRPAPAPGPAVQTVGHFYEPGTVKRNTPEMVAANGSLYYIEIASSPSEDISRRNGKFLADHGIDVSMEKKLIQKTVMFQLVTVQGFPTTTAAEPFVKRIREIGHELPEYKRTHKAWDDAFPTKYQSGANP